MDKWLILSGVLLHAFSGVPGLFRRAGGDGGQRVSVVMSVAGSVFGLAGALLSLFHPVVLTRWVRIDAVAVVFVVPVFLISALGGIYGLEYWSQARHMQNGRKLRLFYGLMTAALAAVVLAANSIVFIVAWEVMALSAFFLVTTEDEGRVVREAGWIYLVTTHVSTLCLFALFALLRVLSGSCALGPIAPGVVSGGMATALFVLSLVAFGCKAGVMPLHVWLPGAHAMAPSHVSAMMSGVLIKIGVYGLVRMISWLPSPPLWWGGVIIAAGVVSGVLGVVLALGQHDIKRLLAYHSIENIGIIVMGLGIALAGRAMNCAEWVVLGLAGALLHVWNHGLFKALLFLSAGSVIHVTHTRDIDHMGGLARVMPRTALMFAGGAVAICGLPPLNGFVSELFIYLGSFRAMGLNQGPACGVAAVAAPALALIGALAVACFVKAFGIVFLGEARSPHMKHAHEVGDQMTGPMEVLFACCAVIGLLPLCVAPLLDRAAADWGAGLALSLPPLGSLVPLRCISLAALALLALLGLASWLLATQVRINGSVPGVTWDCGYAAPTARMQYTASSFAQILAGLFSWVQQPRIHAPGDLPLFPGRTKFRSHALDVMLDSVLKPLFRAGARLLTSFRVLQAGNIHAYLFYIVVFLIVMLLWR